MQLFYVIPQNYEKCFFSVLSFFACLMNAQDYKIEFEKTICRCLEEEKEIGCIRF